MARKYPRALLPALALAVAACGKARSEASDEVLRKVVRHYADGAFATYAESVRRLDALHASVQALVADPAATSLEAARAAYLTAREPYRSSEVYRFYGGPIDRVEVAVNTWPIDESFVESGSDSVPGIIEDVARHPRLDAPLLAALNGRDGETTISTGYHVIEFLLWGRDERADGPGQRPASDFAARVPDARAAQVAERRGQYLLAATELLRDQLVGVRDAWREGPSTTYRAQLLGLPPREALERVVRGMGVLSGPELAGERLTVAYETKEQENEHSCFSDSTTDDLVGNVAGLAAVCTGDYGELLPRGPGVCDAIDALVPGEGRALRERIARSVEQVGAIPAPFDRAILGSDATTGRRAIDGSIRALRAQAEKLGAIAARLRTARPEEELR